MTESLPQEVSEKMLTQIPASIYGTPEDLADTVLFLVSDLAKYTTGQVINVDGSLVM